jgi:ferredoxin-NADP reductase
LYLTCTRLEEKGSWDGGMGRIDIACVKEIVGELKGKVFYLCGGPELVETFEKVLIEEGIPKTDIRKERFY